MSFDEIESVLGFPLPAVARSSRAWWSNNPSNNVMTGVWIGAGFRSEQVDMSAATVVFRRAATSAPPRPATAEHERLSPLFGCLKGTVRRAPDLDLTAPADPAWGLDL